jgi:hypothetical protein
MTIRRLKNLKIPRLIGYLIIGNLLILESMSAQSFFSMRGFGEEIICTDAAAGSLGSLVALSRENPAYPMIMNKTTFFATVQSNFVYGHENGQNRMIHDIRPVIVDGKIPFPYQFRVGITLSEMFNQNFDIYSDSIPFSGYWTRRHIIGQGGIYRIAVNAGKSFFKQKLTCGIEYSRLLGQGLERWYFEVLNGNYITIDSVYTNYSAHSLRFGACANIAFLSLGLYAEDILPGTINSRVISHGAVVDSVSGLQFNLPYGIGFGLGVNKLTNTKFYLDVLYKNWKETYLADTLITGFNNSLKVSFAVEHWLSDNYPLKVGIRYYTPYLSDRTGNQIHEYALTCGSSVPIPKFGTFDYSLEIIRRQGENLKETIGRINVSLLYEEIWKKRTRQWGY